MTKDNNGGAVGTEKKKAVKTVLWEDTLILAFRDLQWRRWYKDVADAWKANDATRVATLEESGPDDFHKLDGKAESLFGDILTSDKGRHFVLEFKRTRADHSSERGKLMFENVATYLATEKDDDVRKGFIELSKSCHFGVYGKRLKNPNNAQGSPNVPRMGNLAIKAQPYLDWIFVDNHWLLSNPERVKADKIVQRQKRRAALNTILGKGDCPSLDEAMVDMEDITKTKQSNLATVMWGDGGRPRGAKEQDFIKYLTLLTDAVGGGAESPITLVSVVETPVGGTMIYYWTTSLEHLSVTLEQRLKLKNPAIAIQPGTDAGSKKFKMV